MEIDQETDHIGYYKVNGGFEGYDGSVSMEAVFYKYSLNPIRTLLVL